MRERSTSNPVFARAEAFSGGQRYANFTAPSSDRMAPDALQSMYNAPSATSLQTGRLTIEDVVAKTGAMLAVLVVAAAATWTLGLDFLLLPALIVGLVLGLVISFKTITNPAVVLSYAAIQGVVLGSISKFFEASYPGIVVQAVIGTGLVFAAMLFLYRSGRIRVTPKFTKMVTAALFAALGLMVVNLVAGMFGSDLGIRDGGPLSILVSLAFIAIGAATLAIDFEFATQLARQGAPAKLAWFVAFGLIVSLVWLYIEILRLISYFRE